MYWSLDKGYLVYLFSVAYLQHWNWPFVFSTDSGHIRHNKSADLAIQRSQGQNLTITQTPALWELHFSVHITMVQSNALSPGFVESP